MNNLHRELAPISDAAWAQIEEETKRTLKRILADDASRTRADSTVRIDLRKLESLSGPEADMLNRYLTMIQVQRQDFNGRVLTMRADDVRAIACILDVEADHAARRLEDLGLRLPRP